jgi:hypothetical protein
VPRIAQVLTSLRLASARATSPLRGERCRTATAQSAADATCACTPQSRRTTLTAPVTVPVRDGGGRSSNWRRIRHASTRSHVRSRVRLTRQP